MSTTTAVSTLHDAALDYVTRYGWTVIRLWGLHQDTDGVLICDCRLGAECTKSGKHPHALDGSWETTTAENVIAQWFTEYPNANIGLTTGGAFGVAVDLDRPKLTNGMREGSDEWFKLQAIYGQAPVTLTALTGSGGRHLIFTEPPGYWSGNTLPALKGLNGCIDARGDGGYIVAAPSLHVSGSRYEWVDLDTERAQLPLWVYDTPQLPEWEPRRNPKGRPAPRMSKPPSGLTAKALALQELHETPDALLGRATSDLIRDGIPDGDQSTVVARICMGAASVGYPEADLYETLKLTSNIGGLGLRSRLKEKGEPTARAWFRESMVSAYEKLAEHLIADGGLSTEVDTYAWQTTRFVGRNGKAQTILGKTLRRVIIAGLDIAERTLTTAPMIGVTGQLPSMTGLSANACRRAVEALEWLGWWIPENVSVPGAWDGMSNAYVYHFNLDPDSRLNPPHKVTPNSVLRQPRMGTVEPLREPGATIYRQSGLNVSHEPL
jgi:hypothetical protein